MVRAESRFGERSASTNPDARRRCEDSDPHRMRRKLDEIFAMTALLHSQLRLRSAANDAQAESDAECAGAGDGNRTHVCSLGSCRSTIELRPREDAYILRWHCLGSCRSPRPWLTRRALPALAGPPDLRVRYANRRPPIELRPREDARGPKILYRTAPLECAASTGNVTPLREGKSGEQNIRPSCWRARKAEGVAHDLSDCFV
jgi:hypothetical protein